MPYTIRKQKCKQSDGDSGGYTLSYTDNKGKKHRVCHTSKKKARGQIAAIEGPRENYEIVPRADSIDENLLRNCIRVILESPAAASEAVLMSSLKNLGFTDVEKKTATTYVVLVSGGQKDRLQAYSDIEGALKRKGAVWDQAPSSASSLGAILFGNMKIYVKPIGKQGGKSAGLENESGLVDAINTLLSSNPDGINVNFVSGKKNFYVENVVGASGAGLDTAGRKKSDVNLITINGVIPVSIKKDNAEYWESADAYYGARASEIIDALYSDDQIAVWDMGSYYTIEPNIAVRATSDEVVDVVFGSDILGNGAVIKRTFTASDFNFDEDTSTLTVTATSIITKPSDVKGDESVWFLIRNDKTRKGIPGYPGLRVLAAYEKRINPNVKRIEGI